MSPSLAASGVVCGYVVISLCESFFHRRIQHAGPVSRRGYRKAGTLGRALLEAWYSHHVVHHFLTFRTNHVTQFASEHEQAEVDAFLKARNFHTFIMCRYGVILGVEFRDYVRYIGPTLPIFGSVCVVGGPGFALGAFVPLVLWPMLAQFVHPYLHLPRDDVLASGPLAIRLLARTPYFRVLARHHWLHHKYTSCNYNLLLGGDFLLGVWRGASPRDLDEMRAIGLI